MLDGGVVRLVDENAADISSTVINQICRGYAVMAGVIRLIDENAADISSTVINQICRGYAVIAGVIVSSMRMRPIYRLP